MSWPALEGQPGTPAQCGGCHTPGGLKWTRRREWHEADQGITSYTVEAKGNGKPGGPVALR